MRKTSGIVAYVLDWDTVVSEFELQSCYDVHFRTNALWKGMKPFIVLAMGQIVSHLLFCNDGFH